ncbi:MAG: DNA polymerase II large subunit, partial [Candidatus Micrarchaeota archaeon]|nr:DNA polymerase II large subunit [Candidatus Micrarchaeota archaeon]
SAEEAAKILPEVRKILFLGDILVSYGDFLKSNSTLLPCGYCEERWELELAKASGGKHAKVNHAELTAEEAFKISESHSVPLHPKYTYPWNDISPEQMQALARWLAGGKLKYDWFKLRELSIEAAPEKTILEELCIPHAVRGSEVVLSGDHAHALLRSLGMLKGKAVTLEKFEKEFNAGVKPVELASKLAGVRVMQKAPVYIGSRMGRPEKARERRMKPAPHVLFPIGSAGGKLRSITKAYKFAKERRHEGMEVMEEVARLRCPSCGVVGILNKCPSCGARTILQRTCSKCGRPADGETCPCGGTAYPYDTRPVDLPGIMDRASERVGHMPVELKGVKGMTSAAKIPEPLEKGLLREKHGVFVFKDGTARFDATDMTITHFYPREIGVTVEKLRELGYAKDFEGKELASPDQLLELKPQDLLLSENGADYISKVAKFVDDELVYLYGLSPFYNIKSREGLLGQLVVGLSPHTSAGVLARIIGFTKAHVGYAHPYFHAAKRRNCDGDEDAIMLLMDALLNFSRAFLPASRGGQMDAALVLSTIIDPKEVDDEVHAMEVCSSYPLELYEAADNFSSPGEIKLEKVGDRLGTPGQYSGLMFTHRASSIHDGPVMTRYVELKTMKEKIAAQFALCAKIRAVDVKDAAERVVLQHFIPDLYGNLRSFSRQVFRCVNCNSKYRRVPLRGKCTRCGGKLLLTINKGGIEKYLKISQEMVAQYELPDYLKQRLALLEVEIASVFEDETSKQFNLSEFM